LTSPKRAREGPASRIEARMMLACSSEISELVMPLQWICKVPGSGLVIDAPMPSRMRSRDLTSPMSGTLCNVTGSSVRRQAAIMGRAAFLLPDGSKCPCSRVGPLTRKLVIPIVRVAATCPCAYHLSDTYCDL